MEHELKHMQTPDRETQRTGKLAVLFAVGTAFAGLSAIPIVTYFGSTYSALFILLVIPLLGSVPLTLRVTGSARLAAQHFLVALWILVTGVILVLGAPDSPALTSYAIIILGATFLTGKSSGIKWMIICVVSIGLVEFVIIYFEIPQALSDRHNDIFIIISSSINVVLFGLFALLYDSAKNTALQDLRAANLRIAQMIAQLEEASSRLIASSERFLGSRVENKVGLVSKMMSKAHGGRMSIDQLREGIHGMIQQYRDIGSRVQSLHQHSQAIVEVVATIDRISNRLDVMALNVGIEASQSGSVSKQFAIIADDMRLLAERVLTETKQIKGSLRKVQIQIREVLDSSARGQELTEENATRLAATAATFEDIYGLITETEGATEQMTADTLAQIDAVRKLVTAATAS